MKAIGATPGIVARVVIGEGLLVGAVSWVLAMVLAAPLALWLGGVLGKTGAFGAPPLGPGVAHGSAGVAGVTSLVSFTA
jgi:putative ABC transport system permease protein